MNFCFVTVKEEVDMRSPAMEGYFVGKAPVTVHEEFRDNNGPELSPLSKDLLHEQIYDVLKQNLMRGRFAPSQKLPLRGLARSLGTSLMPVRDALQRLEMVGGVVMNRSRTMMVPVYSKKQIDDILKLRVLMEGEAAQMAAMHRSEDHLVTLRQACRDTEASAGPYDIDLFLDANYTFHMTVAEASGISFIGSMLEPLWMRLGPLIRESTPSQADIRKAAHLHLLTYTAIAEQDPKAAREAVVRDIFEGNQFGESQADREIDMVAE